MHSARGMAEAARQRRRQRTLAGAGEAADRDKPRHLRAQKIFRRTQELPRLGAVIPGIEIGQRRRHQCANCGPQRQKQRQRRQSFKLLLNFRRAPQIAVEEEIGVVAQPSLPEIHQHEGEVVENVDGRQPIVEFDRVKQNGPTGFEDDVAQVKVAVAAAHLALRFPPFKQRRNGRIGGQKLRPQIRDRGGGKGRRRGEPVERVGHPAAESLRRAPFMARRARVGGGNGLGKPGGGRKIEFAAPCELVERLVVVETAGMDCPFDNVAIFTTQAKTLRRTPDRQNFEINVRCVRAIDPNLVLGSGAALSKRREIHERIIDRALDLIGVRPSEKHHGAVRIYALY